MAVQGVHPAHFYEKGRALWATVTALAIWAFLVAGLIAILITTGGVGSLLPHILP